MEDGPSARVGTHAAAGLGAVRRRGPQWFAGGSTIVLLASLLFVGDLDAQVEPWSDDSPHEVGSVTVAPGVHLEVLDWGGAGETLVFLAGLTHNAHVFDEFAPRFSDRFRVIGITRRGHGNSSWPDSGYDLATLVQDLEAALDSLGIQRAFLAGHSYGGAEVTRFASENPDRVAGLIYIDGIQELTNAGDLSACPVGPELLEAMERTFSDPEGFRQLQLRIGNDGSSQPNIAEAVRQIGQNSDAFDYSTVSVPALAVSYVPERAEEIFLGVTELSQRCVSAAQRMIFEGLSNFARTMDRGTIVALQDGNHNLHLAAPDAVEAAMRRWLAEQEEG